MEDTDWTKYSDKSLDLVLEQSSELLKETMQSFREITNKTYGLLAIYLGVISYASNKAMAVWDTVEVIPYCVLVLGVIVGIYIIWSNLLPSAMSFNGTYPSLLIHKYYEKFELDIVLREQKIALLKGNEDSINDNYAIIESKQESFECSILVVWITLFLFALTFILFH